ncbi:hypothetical protein ACP86_02310 [Marinobacter sp. CP1]|jgi:glycosyltransferase involved in cell wall biosynthesis|uniref:glycosyltransferase family 4 protein n=1 Tax=Marinobacter sp. CP1 TaxID=1671721 RepID=UPI00069E2CCD|nr:glycosyltransferase family 4 protein [Marinobacter sp. CP1]AKV95088.1 hypothetical protein ACP86_02310 [Marinobacter sp. CP1]
MTRIVFIITSKGKPGGVERRFLRVAEFLNDQPGTECVVLASASFFSGFKLDQVKTVELEATGLVRRAVEITDFVRQYGISHVHIASNPGLLSAFLCGIIRVLGKKVSISSVNSSKVNRQHFEIRSRIAHRVAYKFANKVDFLSDSILEKHQELFGVPKSKGRVSECSFLANKLETVNSGERNIDICFVARLVPLKGIELLLDALSEIQPTLNVRICGDGPMKSYIHSRVDVLKSHNITVGYCENPIDILSKSKIFVSLQTYNNYPSQSVFEAIKSGCLVIATDVGETRKILNDENSILIKDRAMLISAINTALKNDDFRDSLISESRKVFRKHNIKNFSDYFATEILEVEPSN